MSGQEDLQKLVERLEEIQSELHVEDKSLDETVIATAEAMTSYRTFMKAFQSKRFEVKMLEKSEGGEIKESRFNWQALE